MTVYRIDSFTLDGLTDYWVNETTGPFKTYRDAADYVMRLDSNAVIETDVPANRPPRRKTRKIQSSGNGIARLSQMLQF